MKNHLGQARSPYLRQHRDNPVHWYEWSPEALRRAQSENKPILLSIGYSACHWCHVMEKESFSGQQIADFLNTHFISIKVDREERPDLDHLYMKAVQAMSGQGGWPLNVFLTPDLRPFYGGTYFAPDRRYNRPSFMEVLERVNAVFQTQRDEVRKAADSLTNFLFQSTRYFESKARNEVQLHPKVLKNFEHLYDKENGGFGPAPKFFYTDGLRLFLWEMEKQNSGFHAEALKNTLNKMALGGVFDQVGGGFHRYSTDAAWKIPHYEKMLYDNALLIETYSLAFQKTKSEFYLEVAKRSADWLMNSLRSSDGLFYSATDADSEGEEGRYFVWTSKEIEASLESKLYAQAPELIAIEGLRGPILRKKEDSSPELSQIYDQLLAARNQRVAPALDDKVLVSWNGLAVSALCELYAACEEIKYLQAAEAAADRLWERAWKNSRLRHLVYQDAGQESFLEDAAYFGRGLIQVFYETQNLKYFEWALELANSLLSDFYDASVGGFWTTPEDQKDLLLRSKEIHDGALPAPFAVAISFLYDLYLLTADEKYGSAAYKSFESILGNANDQPGGFGSLAWVAAEFDHKKIMIGSVKTKPPVQSSMMIRYLSDLKHPRLSITKDKSPADGRFYLCDAQSCQILESDPSRSIVNAP